MPTQGEGFSPPPHRSGRDGWRGRQRRPGRAGTSCPQGAVIRPTFYIPTQMSAGFSADVSGSSHSFVSAPIGNRELVGAVDRAAADGVTAVIRPTFYTQMSVEIRADVSRSSRFDVSAGPDAAALSQARHDGRPEVVSAVSRRAPERHRRAHSEALSFDRRSTARGILGRIRVGLVPPEAPRTGLSFNRRPTRARPSSLASKRPGSR